jgi:hypothetical protein
MLLRTTVRITIGAALLVVTTVTTVPATMVRRMSLAEVTHEAARIVHATVRQVRVGRDQSGLPATWVTLDVTRILKGDGRGQLTIKQYGVATPLPDGTITRVAGLPRYRVGEEVVLFLSGTSSRGFTSPVGFAQGAYRVSRPGGAPRVRSDLESQGAPRGLDAFLSEVTGLVRQVP